MHLQPNGFNKIKKIDSKHWINTVFTEGLKTTSPSCFSLVHYVIYHISISTLFFRDCIYRCDSNMLSHCFYTDVIHGRYSTRDPNSHRAPDLPSLRVQALTVGQLWSAALLLRLTLHLYLCLGLRWFSWMPVEFRGSWKFHAVPASSACSHATS